MAIDPEMLERAFCMGRAEKLKGDQLSIHGGDPTEGPSLEDLARKIEHHERQSGEHVVTAAVLVAEARSRVKNGEAGKVSWSDWARQHIELSSSRLSELLRIGQADDPRAELEKVRAQTRGRVQKLRATRAARKSALEPERSKLIDWAKSAPIDSVKRILKAAVEDLEAADPLA